MAFAAATTAAILVVVIINASGISFAAAIVFIPGLLAPLFMG
jgi:hypothetical protein